MRTRHQSKRSGGQEATKDRCDLEGTDDYETLSNNSRASVGKLLKRVKKGFNKDGVSYLCHEESSQAKSATKGFDENHVDTARKSEAAVPVSCVAETLLHAPSPGKNGNENEYNDSEWEDGFVPPLSSSKDLQEDLTNGVFVEFDISNEAKKKLVRRATAEEKEFAELAHKTHLLCLLGRGRLIDRACNDPLIQASLLSLVPTHFLKMSENPKLTAKDLSVLVSWFHNNFHVRSPYTAEKSCQLALVSALESREGTQEVIVALSVALFRALNLTARFVSILDVISIKPDGDKMEPAMEVVNKRSKGVFSSSTLMVAEPSCSSACSMKTSPKIEHDNDQASVIASGRYKNNKSSKRMFQTQKSPANDKMKETSSEEPVSEAQVEICETNLVKSNGLKRKGDVEFQMQMEIALAATAIGSSKDNVASNVSEPSTSSTLAPPFKKVKIIKNDEFQTSSNEISTAIGSKKVGAQLYWAEVFCSGENLTGRWVHVDSVNSIIDGEDKVEAAAAACKKSLRYVVAFAGHGAKDVTRRYCTKWHKVAARRVNSYWWDAVLAPLRELESASTAGVVNFAGQQKSEASLLSNANDGYLNRDNSYGSSTRSSLEDMELETRALTEPLPTNQQAYRNHHLYVIERWIKKYEILYPKGPLLGFCSGHPVYPRSCVQTLHTKERWLREGLQVKAGEVPAKVMKRSLKHSKEDAEDENENEFIDEQWITSLYGKWQTEPLRLPQAVNGIVPKNERGQVDVWSEKCLPPGTAHLPFPRIAQVAKRLDIDYAPAMVGFEFRNGRAAPLYEGIVVCAEFKDAILQAYLEEEERRTAEEKRKTELQALSRWYQLLSSIITRQRLNNSYGVDKPLSESSIERQKSDKICSTSAITTQKTGSSPGRKCSNTSPAITTENHEHEFILEETSDEEEGRTLVKKCRCGFSIEFEVL